MQNLVPSKTPKTESISLTLWNLQIMDFLCQPCLIGPSQIKPKLKTLDPRLHQLQSCWQKPTKSSRIIQVQHIWKISKLTMNHQHFWDMTFDEPNDMVISLISRFNRTVQNPDLWRSQWCHSMFRHHWCFYKDASAFVAEANLEVSTSRVAMWSVSDRRIHSRYFCPKDVWKLWNIPNKILKFIW